MLSKHNHRIYALPTVLFLFLTFLFVSAGVFIQNDERAARISKAQSVAEQVKISLEVFSSLDNGGRKMSENTDYHSP